jgi:hypothetical protein
VPRFSVIIPTFNRFDFLVEALESVWKQTYTDYELIVVDDGSTDATPQFLADLGDRVRVVRQQNLGPGAARNLGVGHATGDYLAFLDSDDLWFPWTLEAYSAAVQKKGPSIVAGHSIPLAEAGHAPKVNGQFELVCYENFFDAWRQGHGFKGTPGLAINTRAFKSVGGFQPRFVNGEDQDLCLRLGVAPVAVQVTTPPVFLHRAHDEHVSRNFKRAVAGVDTLLQRERHGEYPGGDEWRTFRRRILPATARSVSMQAARQRQFSDGLRLFLQTFVWQVRLGHIRYVASFPFYLMMCVFTGSAPKSNPTGNVSQL